MTKFTKILAAVVAASAVLSLAGCGNKDNSTDSSSSSASDSSAVASTAEASTASSAEVSAPAIYTLSLHDALPILLRFPHLLPLRLLHSTSPECMAHGLWQLSTMVPTQ